jgi:vacuolar protein sorting-associated protein 13A/C
MNYLNEFQKMHFLLEAARKAAYDSAAQIQETAGSRFHFNVQMQTPILVFPDPSLLSEKSMTMYLGKLTAMNNFTELDAVKFGAEKPILIDEITATLQSMKLTSSDCFTTPELDAKDIEVLEDVHIDYYWQRFNINLDRITKNDAIKPDSEVGYIFMWRNSIF